ncbi:epidermal retinol dehydrogenase 2-like [Anoplolepis gracilipes]|uniref:epidermal retinol dehydrogenase 2-like n=1 Tax=Anoplolepis gracilipes TaxID=354296 RepID=UPI003B9F2F07
MNEIKMMGKNSVHAYQCNVADRNEVFRVAEKVRTEVGDVTILIDNAGIIFLKKDLDQSVDEITRVTDVNIMSHYWTLQAFLPSMIEKNRGHVVAVSSVAAFYSGTYGTVYCPSKFAVKALMEAVIDQLSTDSREIFFIKFTTVYPVLLTGFAKKSKMRFPSIMARLTPQKAASLIKIDVQ